MLCQSRFDSQNFLGGLTAEEATGPEHLVAAVADRAANSGRVAPDHLREVAPGRLEVRIVVRVLGLLLVPAVGGGASEFDPRVIVAWCGLDGRKIASRAVLCH